MEYAELLSNILLVVPIAYFAYQFFRGDRKKALAFLSAYLLLSGIVILTKFVLKVPRPAGAETHFDPYSFPSFHAAYASLFFFILPNVWTLLYAVTVGALRVLAGVHRWIDVIGGFIFAGAVWWLYKQGRNRVGFEWDRQAFHMGTGALLGLVFYKSTVLGVAISVAAILVGVVAYFFRGSWLIRPFLEFFDRDGTGRGAFTFLIGALLAALVKPSWAWISIWYLAYVDSVATVAGKWFRTRGKSIYGTLGGFLAGILVAIATNTPLWLPAVISAVELLPVIDDNLSITVVVALVGRWLG